MNLSLYLESDKGRIGVVRNPYERLVSAYYQSLDYIGFDKWIEEQQIPTQYSLYKDCPHLIRFEDWLAEKKRFEEVANMLGKDTAKYLKENNK